MSENNKTGKSIDFLPMMDLIARRYLELIAFAAAGLLTAFIFSKVVTPLYESSVIMYRAIPIRGKSNWRISLLDMKFRPSG